jgi:hypothetical protein
VQEQVTYRNQTGATLSSLVFQVTPAYYDAFELQAARVDGAAAESSLDGTVLEVALGRPVQTGETVDVSLDFHLSVPSQEGRFGAGPHALALGNWFPILAPYRDGWFRHQYREVGDAFFTEVADFEVTLHGQPDLQVANTGTVAEHTEGRWVIEASSVRDFALVVSPEFVHLTSSGQGVRVEGYGFSETSVRNSLRAAKRYLAWYSQTLGDYPYPDLDVVSLDLPASYGGMEYPGLVMIDANVAMPDPPDGSYAEYLLAHEIAHQWFYSWVGNDEVEDPWLDEALATYLPLFYDKLERPSLYSATWNANVASGYDQRVAAAGDLPTSSNIDAFPSDSPYYAIVYAKGAHYLASLNDTLGDEGFADLLRAYVARFHDKVSTPRAFLDLAQSRTDANLNPLGAAYFHYGLLTYPTPPEWSVTLPAGPLSGQETVTVGASFAVKSQQILLDGATVYDGSLGAASIDVSGFEPGDYLLLVRLTDDQDALLERARRVTIAPVAIQDPADVNAAR